MIEHLPGSSTHGLGERVEGWFAVCAYGCSDGSEDPATAIMRDHNPWAADLLEKNEDWPPCGLSMVTFLDQDTRERGLVGIILDTGTSRGRRQLGEMMRGLDGLGIECCWEHGCLSSKVVEQLRAQKPTRDERTAVERLLDELSHRAALAGASARAAGVGGDRVELAGRNLRPSVNYSGHA